MSIVIDYTKGFFEASPAGEKVVYLTTPDGAMEIFLNNGNVFSVNVNETDAGSVSVSFENAPSSGTACGFTLKITPSVTCTITWPASVDWAGGTAPDAPASGETDVYAFYTQDGGTTYYGFQAGDAMA